jgi:flagellar basal-body rod modification protein FlgD
MTTIIPSTTTNVTSGVNTSNTGTSATDSATLASNFTAFLQLLTTQLKNQNPLDPLDTNQFTQQLVQFSQVEQQLKSNDQLATLVSLQESTQQTQALGFVGQTVSVEGASTELANKRAFWTFNSTKPAVATVNVLNSAGATVYSGSFSVDAGAQNFVWDGRGTNGQQQPDGVYTIAVTGKDASGQSVAISTEIQGVVDSVDMTKNPPTLSIGENEYTLDKIKRVVRTTQATTDD